jgi:hypothetical protein
MGLFQSFATGVIDTDSKFTGGTSGKFATGVVHTSGAHRLANISANFRIVRNEPNVIFRGLGENDS